MGTDCGCRNLRTYVAEDIICHIRVVLCPVSKLGKGESQVGDTSKIGILFERVRVFVINDSQAVKADTVGDTPVCKLAGSCCGMRLGIGVVYVEVGVGNTGINGNIVCIALTTVVEDIIKDMHRRRVLATEGTCGRLVGTCVERYSVKVNTDMLGEGVNPYARRGE